MRRSTIGSPTAGVSRTCSSATPASTSPGARPPAPDWSRTIDSEDFRRTLDVNLVGTFHAIQVFGAAMADAGRGSIVNIGSIYASLAPDPKLYDHMPVDPPFLKPPAYGASKAGSST